MALSPNLMIMDRAIEKAARSLVRDFNEVEKLQISVKGPGDFVSRADKRSEEIIVENLRKDRPDWGFLGEEGTSEKGKDDRYRWIIDPLDGTSNFLHAVPHWCITVALEKDGEVVAGMTFDPLRQEMFRSEKGAGAFMNNTRLFVSGRKDFSQAMVSLDIGKEKTNAVKVTEMNDLQMKLNAMGTAVRFYGSGALDAAYVAAGRMDAVMFWGAQPWDIAAGILFIREARGLITDAALRPASSNYGVFIMGNPELHGKLAEMAGLKTAR